jgi:hypothetical protein
MLQGCGLEPKLENLKLHLCHASDPGDCLPSRSRSEVVPYRISSRSMSWLSSLHNRRLEDTSPHFSLQRQLVYAVVPWWVIGLEEFVPQSGFKSAC